MDKRVRHGEVGFTQDAEAIMLDAKDEVAAFATATADGGEEHALFASKHDRYIDDLTGLDLDPDLCKAARKKELEYFKSKGVWDFRQVSEAMRKMGKRPLSVRWVETNKGDDVLCVQMPTDTIFCDYLAWELGLRQKWYWFTRGHIEAIWRSVKRSKRQL